MRKIKVKVRRTSGGDYVIESIQGAASFSLNNTPRCSNRGHKYFAGNTIIQEEADYMAHEVDLTVLAPKGE